MTLLVNIVVDAGLASAGASLCYLLLWWKDRNLKDAKRLEAEALVAKARSEAESISLLPQAGLLLVHISLRLDNPLELGIDESFALAQAALQFRAFSAAGGK